MQQQNISNLKKQNILPSQEFELYELTKASGVIIDPQLFSIILELLRLDISPNQLFDILHIVAVQDPHNTQSKKNYQNKESSTAHYAEKKKPPVAAKPKRIKESTNNVL